MVQEKVGAFNKILPPHRRIKGGVPDDYFIGYHSMMVKRFNNNYFESIFDNEPHLYKLSDDGKTVEIHHETNQPGVYVYMSTRNIVSLHRMHNTRGEPTISRDGHEEYHLWYSVELVHENPNILKVVKDCGIADYLKKKKWDLAWYLRTFA